MKKNYLTIAGSFVCSLLLAQQNQAVIAGAQIDYLSSRTNLPLQVSFGDTKHLSDSQFTEWLQHDLVGSQEISFQPLRTEFDQTGNKHSRYQEYYKGYRIEGSMVIAHSRNNEVGSFNGDWFKEINPENGPGLSEQQALQFALAKVNAKKYKWENKAEEAHKKEVFNDPGFTYYPKGELVLLPEIHAATKTVSYRYAYKFNIYAELPLYRANVYVDAASGKVIKEQNLICTIDAVGSANTKYSGTQPMTTDSYTGGYRLRETGRGGGIETYNLNNSTNYTNTDFTNTTNTWTITTSNQAATDAHWGAEKTYDFYYQTYNRNSIDNAGYKLLNYVHYDVNYVNAFWDGQEMTYGDGDVSQGFTIMTALDVCGHEITHGVVQNTAGLNGGEADALNEAFADIFGTSIEWFARPSQHDWIMGKDIMPSGTGIRNMSNPNQLQQPDTYMGTYWDPNDEPHTNNGPCIYWFYLLSVGGSGTNDNGQAYSVSAITMTKAEAIAYRAMTVYMTPSTNYSDVRNYTIQAAKDLYGPCSNEVIQTTNAWHAVGVGAVYTAGAINPAFAADAVTSCSLPVAINFNNTTANGSAFTWLFGDGATSTAMNPSHTYTANGTYSVKLVATGCVAGTKDSVLKSSYITISAPAAPSTTNINICNSGSGQLNASGGSGTIKWYDAASGGNLLTTGGSYVTPVLNTTTTYYAVSTVTNAPVYGGPATNTTFGAGSNFNANTVHYLEFDVLQPCTLKTVLVVANSAGNRVIELRNSSGTVLQSATVNIPAGTQTVTLNFTLTPGTNYQLGTGGTLVDLYRNNSGSGYPYNIGNMVNITTCDVSNSYYYYFYHWQVQQADCHSAATAATAYVNVCTGITESLTEGGILLYPNPASDRVIFTMPKELVSSAKSIEVYDALGKIVRTVPVSSEQTLIDIADLLHGVYSCRIVTTSGERIVKRFIKD